MDVKLTPDQEALIRQAVANGRYRSADEAVSDAMAQWEERERTRIDLIAALDAADEDLATGRYTDYSDETLPQMAEELKREARALRDQERRSWRTG